MLNTTQETNRMDRELASIDARMEAKWAEIERTGAMISMKAAALLDRDFDHYDRLVEVERITETAVLA